MLAPDIDNLWTQVGWAFYGSGTRAVTSIVYTVGPVLVTEAAKAQRLGDHSPPPTHAPPGNHSNASAALPADSDELPVVLADGVEVLATQLSTLALSFSLLLQCVTSIFLAQLADARGWRLRMLVIHVVLGAACALALGLTPPDTPALLQALLLAMTFYGLALAWMFVNGFLPLVASPARRPTVSLGAAALASAGGAAFLLVQYSMLSEAGAEADSLTTASMKRVCSLAALCWLVGAAPTFFALRGVAQPEPRDEAVGACTRLLRGIGRLQHHPHARGYLLSQTFYLAAASNDGATAALFAVEVLDMEVGAITLVTLYAAVVSIGGAVATLVLSKLWAPRPLLLVLMSAAPLCVLYAALALETEAQFWALSCFRAFVAGGLGFSGLNRGLFAQMVPRSRESEFFGLWMVAIKAVSWTVPLLMTALHQISGSFRFAITASLVFYIPALVLAWVTDFDAAYAEAEAADAANESDGLLGAKKAPAEAKPS